MSKTLAYAILFMVKHPDIQERVAEELKQAIGDGGTFKNAYFIDKIAEQNERRL